MREGLGQGGRHKTPGGVANTPRVEDVLGRQRRPGPSQPPAVEQVIQIGSEPTFTELIGSSLIVDVFVETGHQQLGDLSWLACADDPVVNFSNGDNLSSRTRQKALLGPVEIDGS